MIVDLVLRWLLISPHSALMWTSAIVTMGDAPTIATIRRVDFSVYVQKDMSLSQKMTRLAMKSKSQEYHVYLIGDLRMGKTILL